MTEKGKKKKEKLKGTTTTMNTRKTKINRKKKNGIGEKADSKRNRKVYTSMKIIEQKKYIHMTIKTKET